MAEPTPDQSYCDVGDHQHCSGYTEDEFDAETCMCECHTESAGLTFSVNAEDIVNPDE